METEYLLRSDIFGTTPLYYTVQNEQLFHADNIPDLLPYLEHRRINTDALNEWMKIGYITGDKTMFEGIYRLPPAHQLIKLNTHVTMRYFNPYSIRTIPENLLTTLKECIIDSLHDQSTNTTIGTYLSGGMDTATILALVSKMNIRLKAFTMGFHQVVDEVEDAEALAKYFNVDHVVKYISFDELIRIHDKAIYALGKPSASYYAYTLAEEVSKHTNIVLSGEGSDELFGSYQNTNRFQAIKHDPEKVQAQMRWELTNKLPYDYLETDYHVGRPFGLETRAPFCSTKLLGYINLPLSEKVDFDNNINKIHLRRVMKDILPEKIMKNPKQGFSYKFLDHSGELQGMANEALKDNRVRRLLNEKPKHVPQHPFIHAIGKSILRSRFTTKKLKALVDKNHPTRNMQIWSLQRFLDMFQIEV